MEYGMMVLLLTMFLCGIIVGAKFREWQIKSQPWLFKLKKDSH